MSVQARSQMNATKHIHVRQSGPSLPPAQWPTSVIPPSTSTVSTTKAPPVKQPTVTIPLTTTFTPPASCAENRLSQMPPPGYFIWANEPVPAANHTSSACYPSEFLKAYQSVSSSVAGSSVVPVMSPFVCPSNYCTMFAGENNYVACCPSGFQFHRPDTTIDPGRPGYGGTCYSDFTVSSTYTVTAYNVSGATNLAPWVASTSGAQAFAHPIDGFAPSAPSLGCPTPTPKLTLTQSTQTPTPTSASGSNGPSRAVIAGSAVGGLSGFAVLLTLTLVLLRYIRNQRKPPPLRIQHIDHDTSRSELGCTVMCEKEGNLVFSEMACTEKYGKCGGAGEVNGGWGPFEMSGDTVAELDGANEKQRNSKLEMISRLGK